MAFTGVFIQDRQHLQSPATNGGIRNEVPRPDMVPMPRRGGQPGGNPAPNHFLLRRRHTQPFIAAQTLDVSLAHLPAFTAQQGRDPTIPVTRMFRGQFHQSLP